MLFSVVRRRRYRLSRISAREIALSRTEQYASWENTFVGVSSEVQNAAERSSRTFETAWGGAVRFQKYPIIDSDTYWAIRKRQKVSRTWFFKLSIELEQSVESVVFFFNANSIVVREIEPSLGFSVSLHLSIYDRDSAKHIAAHSLEWCRVKEISFDGNEVSILVIDPENGPVLLKGTAAAVDNWMAILLKDPLIKNGDVRLN